MTLFQLNIALISFTILLVSLMGGCLLYSLHAVKAKLAHSYSENYENYEIENED